MIWDADTFDQAVRSAILAMRSFSITIARHRDLPLQVRYQEFCEDLDRALRRRGLRS